MFFFSFLSFCFFLVLSLYRLTKIFENFHRVDVLEPRDNFHHYSHLVCDGVLGNRCTIWKQKDPTCVNFCIDKTRTHLNAITNEIYDRWEYAEGWIINVFFFHIYTSSIRRFLEVYLYIYRFFFRKISKKKRKKKRRNERVRKGSYSKDF